MIEGYVNPLQRVYNKDIAMDIDKDKDICKSFPCFFQFY